MRADAKAWTLDQMLPYDPSPMVPARDSIIAGSHLKKLARHGSLYMVANVLVSGGSALLLPIYTRELDPDQYAIFKNLISAGLVMAILVSLHMDYAYTRFFVDYDAKPGELKRLFSTMLWFGVLWGGSVCIASYVLLRGWAVHSLGASAWPHLAIACTIPLASKLNVLAAAHFRAYHRSGIVTISSAAGFLSGAAVSIVLLLQFDMGVSALLWGALIGPCVSIVWGYYHLAQDGLIGWVFSFKLLRETLGYSLGVLPMAAAAWLAGQADAIFVAEFDDMTGSGVYSVAFDIGRLINLLVMSIFMAYTPMIFRMLKEDPAKNIVRIEQFQAFLIHVMVGMALFLSLFAPELFELLVRKREYHAGVAIVPYIAFAFVLGGVRKLHSALMYYEKATLLISIGGILQAAIGVGMNVLLIPRYGPVAAAWAKMASLGIGAFYVWCLTRRYRPLHFNGASLGVTLATVAACLAPIWFCKYVLDVSFWPMLGAKMVVLILALVWTWRSRFGDQMRTVVMRRKMPAKPDTLLAATGQPVDAADLAVAQAAEDGEAIADPKEA